MAGQAAAERLYALVANEEDARVCTDISDAACREVPGNFLRMVGANVLTKIGDLLIDPKTVLAWLVVAVGAPAALVGILVPIRESGSMIPQLAIGAWVRHYPLRKWFWVLGSVLQGIAAAAMAAAVWWLEGPVAGLAIVAGLAAFSLSRGLCSVAMKDVQGKTVPRARRGRQAGLAASLSGLVTLGLGVALLSGRSDPGVVFYTALLLAAALCWWLAAAVFARIEEFPGETAGGGHALREAWRNLGLLRTDADFRGFVLARALLMASALGSPFIVLLAEQGSRRMALLGGFVLASSLASTLSASIWGFLADTSSRKVMIRAGGLAALVCLLVPLFAVSLPSAGLLWIYPVAFFVLAIAHAGVRIGRKTYLVDMARGNRRTDYTAVSNSVIGVLLLVVGAFSSALALLGAAWALLLLGVMGLAGAVMSWRLPELAHRSG
ncbi:hypothetical protein [Dokdonella sp.]|uniref:hypothetical protein n=1 Tax=Dokdonella sp. TaxID=2291710 RepID=UPI0031BE4908|nr:hypothetical protein [Dokdonella sp.]